MLRLYFHPLSSFCHKALIALYENATPFEPVIVDLSDAQSVAGFKAVWPMGRFPVLRDEKRDCTVPESTAIIEYLDAFYPGRTRFVPADPEGAWRARLWDRFFDEYVNKPMQKIVTDPLRPEGGRDPFGVEQARLQLDTARALLERELATRAWAAGQTFSLADCSAAPALFYANALKPFDRERNLAAYFERLTTRASIARVLREAEPYFALFPLDQKPRLPEAATG